MIKINPQVFRAYDIRGIYGQDLNTEFARLLGRSLVLFLQPGQTKKLKLALGRDGRLSSPVLAEAIKQGIREGGADVIDIGLVITPMLYYIVRKMRLAGGVQITASHNPKEYNGFKLVREGAVLIAANTGIDKIKELVLKMAENPKLFLPEESRGQFLEKDILPAYLQFALQKFNPSNFKPLRVAIDTGNGAGGRLVAELAKMLAAKIQIYHLFAEIDGTFPNHSPDPSKPENLKDLASFVKKNKYDLGVALDGDGDRIFFIDEKGEVVTSSLILSLLAEIILRDNPGEKIVYTLCMSNIIKDVVKKQGGIPLVTKIGFTFLKEKMREENAIFGGEFSGHYAHRDYGFCEPPLFVLLTVLEEMSKTGQSLSELVASYKKYFFIGTVNLEVSDKKAALRAIQQKYQKGQVSCLDGVRVDFPDWWFNVRASNTEDVLRLVVEGKNKALAQAKVEEIKQAVRPLLFSASENLLGLKKPRE